MSRFVSYCSFRSFDSRSFVAELSDDVAVAVASEYFVAFQHIGVIQLFQDIDFGEEQFFQLFAFEGFELDYLDGHNLI